MYLFQRAANMIPAHDSPLAALAFDASGTKLATASEKVEAYSKPTMRSGLASLLTFIFVELYLIHHCMFLGDRHPCVLHSRRSEAL